MTQQNGWVNKAGRSYLDRFVGGGFNFDFSVVILLLSDEASLFVSSIFSDFTVSLLDSAVSESSVRITVKPD